MSQSKVSKLAEISCFWLPDGVFLTFHEMHFARVFLFDPVQTMSDAERKARKSTSNEVQLVSVTAIVQQKKTRQQIVAELGVDQSTV